MYLNVAARPSSLSVFAKMMVPSRVLRVAKPSNGSEGETSRKLASVGRQPFRSARSLQLLPLSVLPWSTLAFLAPSGPAFGAATVDEAIAIGSTSINTLLAVATLFFGSVGFFVTSSAVATRREVKDHVSKEVNNFKTGVKNEVNSVKLELRVVAAGILALLLMQLQPIVSSALRYSPPAGG